MEQSDDGHLVALDLRDLRARAERQLGAATVRSWGAAMLTPATVDGFSDPERSCTSERRWAVRPEATMDLVNLNRRPERVAIGTDLEASPDATQIRVQGPGFDRVVPLIDGRGRLDQTVVLAPGANRLRFRVTGPRVPTLPSDHRTLWFALVDPTLRPAGAPALTTWADSPLATG
jgi:hypothetical protein